MSDKVKGTLLGIAMSLIAVAAWIVLYLLGFVAGIAGAGMGMLFIWGYRRVNKNDKTKFAAIFACILIVVEIIVAEFIIISLIAIGNGFTLYDAVRNSEFRGWIIVDLVVGFALSFLVFCGYLFASKRKNASSAGRRVYTHTHPADNRFYTNPNANQNNGQYFDTNANNGGVQYNDAGTQDPNASQNNGQYFEPDANQNNNQNTPLS